VRLDPSGASDDRKLTGFGCFGPSDKVSDRQAAGGGPYRQCRMGVDYSGMGVDYSGTVSSPRWHCVIIP
jgi:hypothetical protein